MTRCEFSGSQVPTECRGRRGINTERRGPDEEDAHLAATSDHPTPMAWSTAEGAFSWICARVNG